MIGVGWQRISLDLAHGLAAVHDRELHVHEDEIGPCKRALATPACPSGASATC
jgi:hypothetical protein